jgi:hypothetical protein
LDKVQDFLSVSGHAGFFDSRRNFGSNPRHENELDRVVLISFHHYFQYDEPDVIFTQVGFDFFETSLAFTNQFHEIVFQ